jgi:hypothetical protein
MGGPILNPFSAASAKKKYLWGNVPAYEVLQLSSNEGADYNKDLRILFAGMSSQFCLTRVYQMKSYAKKSTQLPETSGMLSKLLLVCCWDLLNASKCSSTTSTWTWLPEISYYSL